MILDADTVAMHLVIEDKKTGERVQRVVRCDTDTREVVVLDIERWQTEKVQVATLQEIPTETTVRHFRVLFNGVCVAETT